MKTLPAFTLLLCCLLCARGLQAQFQKPDMSMPSPNAASLGLYGEVPVSLYTGLPSIEIPIHTIEEGKIKVPISLSYHASGVRVNQHPGWVGLNWNLNAGGAITRVVKDFIDEHAFVDSIGSSNFVPNYGYYFKGSTLNATNWNTKAFVQSLFTESFTGGGYLVKKANVDLQPDEFNFNFLGISGRFFLNPDRKWVVECDQPVRVDLLQEIFLMAPEDLRNATRLDGFRDISYYRYSFRGFILTTADGMRYQFGGDNSSVEYTLPFFASSDFAATEGSPWSVNTWYLTKITSPEGQTVDFDYEVPATFNEGKYIASFYTSLDNLAFESSTTGSPQNYQSCNSFQSLDSAGNYNGFLQRAVYLKEISYAGGKVEFNTQVTTELSFKSHILTAKMHGGEFPDYAGSGYYTWASLYYLSNDVPDANNALTCVNCQDYNRKVALADSIYNRMKWRKLNSITVTDASSTPVKGVELTYLDTPTDRLRLDRVGFKSNDSPSCRQFYDLQYYDDPGFALPDYLDKLDQTDHWGFFNQNPYDLANFPTSYAPHKNASPNIQVLREGSLKKITYPTGGDTEFTYEPHGAYKYQRFSPEGTVDLVENTLAVGGIRIRKTASHGGPQPIEKEYSYRFTEGINEKSSGILNGTPQYSFTYTLYDADQGGSYFTSVHSSQNTLPLSANAHGSHIGYRRVRETRSDGSYRVFTYTNYESADGLHLDKAIGFDKRLQKDGGLYEDKVSLENERGKPLSEQHYTDQGKLIYRKQYAYQRVADQIVRSVYVATVKPCNTLVFIKSGYPYPREIFKYLPSYEETTTYDQTNNSLAATDRTEYLYNTDGLPTDVKTLRNGSYTRTRTRHAGDYTITGTSPSFSDPQSELVYRMQQRGMVGRPVEQQVWNNEAADGQERMTGGYLYTYRDYSTPVQTAAGHASIQVQHTRRFVSLPPPTGVVLSAVTNAGGSFAFAADARYTKTEAEFPTDATAYTQRGEPKRFRGSDGLWTTLTWGDGAETGRLKSQAVGPLTTTFEYAQPLVGVSKITDPTGNWKSFEYDGFNRLLGVRDRQNRLIKSYRYFLTNSSGCL